jgi:DNA-binding SARP family transcriptional activator
MNRSRQGLELRLFGDFFVAYGGKPVSSMSTSRLQSLLAYLLLHRDAPQARHHLAFVLWPDSTDKQALTNLRNLLYRLRRALPDADDFLLVDDQTLQWRAEAPFTFDVIEFESAIARAKQAAQVGDRGALRSALEEAVGLYQGDLLPSCYDDWIITERERLRQAHARALEQLILALEEKRDYRAAIGYAQQSLRHDPLHEATYRSLMRLHALTGDRAGALRVYHTCVTVLERELSVAPTSLTRDLYEQLLVTEEGGEREALVPLPESAPSPSLVGRHHEWAELRDAWQSAAAGRSQLVMIVGEAGIGKTRLAEEFVQWAEHQGVSTATARCYAAEGELVYAPVASWLRSRPLRPLESVWRSEVGRILPELFAQDSTLSPPGPLTEAWQRKRLFEALARAILGDGKPLLLMLDDLQWCDQESLEWLHYLLRYDPRARLLIVGTLRGEEYGDDHPLTLLLRGLRRDGRLAEIRLGPLDETETTSLATNLAGEALDPGVTVCLYGETEGNPLFAVETVRGGLPDTAVESETGELICIPRPLPSKIQDALSARLDQLTPTARELARLAAVIGREFTFSVLSQASDVDEARLVRALDELWQRRIIREQGVDAYDFTHHKLREVALSDLSGARQQLLHRRVAGALESVYADDLGAVSGRIAAHYEHGGRLEQAVPYYQRAAQVARQVYANDEAVRYYRRLLEVKLSEHLSASERAGITLALGKTWQLTGRWTQAEEAYRQALTRAKAARDLRVQAESERALGDVMRLQGSYSDALEWLSKSLDSFEEAGDLQGEMGVLWTMGEVYWYRGEHSRALDALQRQIQIATDLDDQRSIADAAGTMGIVYWSRGDFEQSRMCCRRSMEIADETGHRWAVGRAAITLGNTYSSQSDYSQALGWYRQAFEVASQIGDRQGAGWAISNIGLAYYQVGDFARALPCFEHGLHNASEIGDTWAVSLALGNIGCCYAGLERPQKAEEFFGRGVALGRMMKPHNYMGVMLWDMADFYTRQQRYREAQAFNDQALALAIDADDGRVAGEDLLFKAQTLSVRIRVALGQLDLPEARDELEGMLAEKRAQPQQAVLHYELWRLDQGDGDHRRKAADLYRALYVDAPSYEYRRRYKELSGESLPKSSSLPDLPAIVERDQVDMDTLLAQIDQTIAETASG